ncbi:hypothetical protein [Henriciella sp.]|uniref:hypothetical protein n=1 Tax=Henriciella sp. TaxID=1968823 RepID=UPI002634C415|nr:hypothetical protein [Henriciella sp.]
MIALSRHIPALTTGAVAGLVMTAAGPAAGQAAQQTQDDPPPTTLPFEPTVRSAPPANPTYPNRRPPPEPAPPPDTLCTEIGPIIRAGVTPSRFASLSPSTEEGAVIGTYETGGGIGEIGASYCTVVIPAADPQTAGSPYNQVTCQLGLGHGESPYLDDLRARRDRIANRISECPAVAEWTGSRPGETPLSTGAVTEDHVFNHPDVDVQIVIRASHHEMSGDWPLDHLRTLSLIFRTPNPDRPAPGASDESAGLP